MSHDAKQRRPHFDTNHHLTIVWDADNQKAAEDALTACIQATLPESSLRVEPSPGELTAT